MANSLRDFITDATATGISGVEFDDGVGFFLNGSNLFYRNDEDTGRTGLENSAGEGRNGKSLANGATNVSDEFSEGSVLDTNTSITAVGEAENGTIASGLVSDRGEGLGVAGRRADGGRGEHQSLRGSLDDDESITFDVGGASDQLALSFQNVQHLTARGENNGVAVDATTQQSGQTSIFLTLGDDNGGSQEIELIFDLDTNEVLVGDTIVGTINTSNGNDSVVVLDDSLINGHFTTVSVAAGEGTVFNLQGLVADRAAPEPVALDDEDIIFAEIGDGSANTVLEQNGEPYGFEFDNRNGRNGLEGSFVTADQPENVENPDDRERIEVRFPVGTDVEEEDLSVFEIDASGNVATYNPTQGVGAGGLGRAEIVDGEFVDFVVDDGVFDQFLVQLRDFDGDATDLTIELLEDGAIVGTVTPEFEGISRGAGVTADVFSGGFDLEGETFDGIRINGTDADADGFTVIAVQFFNGDFNITEDDTLAGVNVALTDDNVGDVVAPNVFVDGERNQDIQVLGVDNEGDSLFREEIEFGNNNNGTDGVEAGGFEFDYEAVSEGVESFNSNPGVGVNAPSGGDEAALIESGEVLSVLSDADAETGGDEDFTEGGFTLTFRGETLRDIDFDDFEPMVELYNDGALVAELTGLDYETNQNNQTTFSAQTEFNVSVVNAFDEIRFYGVDGIDYGVSEVIFGDADIIAGL